MRCNNDRSYLLTAMTSLQLIALNFESKLLDNARFFDLGQQKNRMELGMNLTWRNETGVNVNLRHAFRAVWFDDFFATCNA